MAPVKNNLLLGGNGETDWAGPRVVRARCNNRQLVRGVACKHWPKLQPVPLHLAHGVWEGRLAADRAVKDMNLGHQSLLQSFKTLPALALPCPCLRVQAMGLDPSP